MKSLDLTDDELQSTVRAARADAREVIRVRLREELVDAWWPRALSLAGLNETGQSHEDGHARRDEPERAEETCLRIDRPPTADLVYVYGFTSSTAHALEAGVGVEPDSRLDYIVVDGVCALVTRVPADVYGEAGLRERMTDPEWVAERACAHDEVLRSAAELGPVLPLHLCTVYKTEDRVRAILQHNRAAIAHELGEVEGHSEWGVKMHVDPDGQEPPSEATEELEELRAELAGATPGHARFARRRLLQLEHELRAAAAESQGEDAHARLSEVSARSVRLRPQSPALSGKPHPQVLHGAYLVRDSERARFDGAVARLGGQPGLDLYLTGPWPPFHFTRVELQIPGPPSTHA